MKSNHSPLSFPLFSMLLALCAPLVAIAGHHEETPVVEIRIYKILPGKMDDWLLFYHGELVKPQEEAGIKIIAAYTSLDDPNTFIWIRQFSSEEGRKEERQRFYGSDHWKNDLKPRLRDMFEKVEVVYNVTPSLLEHLVPQAPENLTPSL